MDVLFIQTGGTIDKDYPKNINGWGFEIGQPASEKLLSSLRLSLNHRTITAFQKDSTKIDHDDLENLRNICQKAKETKIIITHGTDTILKTAKYLSTIPKKTIVLTGAFLPYTFKNSDAEFNVGMAIAGVQTLSDGIYVSLNGIIGKFNEIQRDETTGKYYKKP